MTKKEKLIESGIRKIYTKILKEDARSDYLIKNIEKFIRDNEGQDLTKVYGGRLPGMELNGNKPMRNVDVTFDELRAFVQALKQMPASPKT